MGFFKFIRLLAFTVLLAVFAAANCDAANDTPAELGHGSLVVIIPSERGLIAVSDRRITYANCSSTDTVTKIVPAGANTFVCSTGYVVFPPRGTCCFDPNTSLKSKLSDLNTSGSISPYAEILRNSIESEFRKYLATKNDLCCNCPVDIYGGVWRSTIVHYNKTARAFEIINLLCSLSDRAKSTIKVGSLLVSPVCFTRTKALCYGNVLVVDAIKSGVDRRFDADRRDPLLQEVLMNPKPPETMSTNRAMLAALKIISVTNQKLHLIDKSEYFVGDTVDIALLSNTGFEWQFRDRKVGELIACLDPAAPSRLLLYLCLLSVVILITCFSAIRTRRKIPTSSATD